MRATMLPSPLIAEWRSSSFSRSIIRSKYGAVDLDEPVGDLVEVVDALDVGAALPAEAFAQLERLDQRSQLLHEVVLRRAYDRHLHAEGLLGLCDGVRIEVRHDLLPVGHRLDREDAVPEVVHLVDDDVGALEPLDRLVVGHAVDDVEVDRQLLARFDDVAGPLLVWIRQRVAAYEPTIHASNFLRYSSSSGGLPRMSAPRKCITDFFRAAFRIGMFSDFGTSVFPK